MAVRAKELHTAEDALSDYGEQFLDCRAGHIFRPVGMFHQGSEVRRLSICSGCDSDRYQRWTARGQVLPTLYRYADGYLVEGGLDRAAARRELMSRRPVYQTEGTMRSAIERKAKNVRKRSTKTRALRAVK